MSKENRNRRSLRDNGAPIFPEERPGTRLTIGGKKGADIPKSETRKAGSEASPSAHLGAAVLFGLKRKTQQLKKNMSAQTFAAICERDYPVINDVPTFEKVRDELRKFRIAEHLPLD